MQNFVRYFFSARMTDHTCFTKSAPDWQTLTFCSLIDRLPLPFTRIAAKQNLRHKNGTGWPDWLIFSLIWRFFAFWAIFRFLGDFCLLVAFSLIGPIYAFWAIVFSGQFYKNYRKSQNFWLRKKVMCQCWQKAGWATHWAISSQTHQVTLQIWNF
jgi:hypothetical protein